MNILVTGGTGTLGTLVVARLQDDHAVRVLSRHASEHGVVADLDTGDGVDGALADIDVVVHCAGGRTGDDVKARR
jgi:nucleoside-diphosphate-sugar epimerase